MKSLFILLVAASLWSSDRVTINLDEIFTIDKTEEAILESDNMLISVGKISDSRCPANTNCVWAGELKIDIAITHGNQSIAKTLVVPAVGKGGSKARFTFDKYELQFLGEENHKAKKDLSLDNTAEPAMRLSFILTKK